MKNVKKTEKMADRLHEEERERLHALSTGLINSLNRHSTLYLISKVPEI